MPKIAIVFGILAMAHTTYFRALPADLNRALVYCLPLDDAIRTVDSLLTFQLWPESFWRGFYHARLSSDTIDYQSATRKLVDLLCSDTRLDAWGPIVVLHNCDKIMAWNAHFPWPVTALRTAAQYGNLEILKQLSVSQSMMVDVLYAAAAVGHTGILEYCLEARGFRLSQTTLDRLLEQCCDNRPRGLCSRELALGRKMIEYLVGKGANVGVLTAEQRRVYNL